MTDPKLSTFLRDRGYEALLILSSFGAMALKPTVRHAVELDAKVGRALDRRNALRALEDRGLVESGPCSGGKILKITALGRSLLAGGRDLEAAWNRPWDGVWRVLNFDIPRTESRTRSQFWRWLRHNHFGMLQGSSWIRPDPIDDVGAVAGQAGLAPSELVAFEGALISKQRPAEIAARAWKLDRVNEAYRHYLDFAENTERELKKKTPGRRRITELLKIDRRSWWSAARTDPLLPKPIHPAGYEGPRAWKARQRLHRNLFKALSALPAP